jgi:2-polyprenyl-6-methoxyphenol hydroxylase-like FAD-dependent oxidoreductase
VSATISEPSPKVSWGAVTRADPDPLGEAEHFDQPGGSRLDVGVGEDRDHRSGRGGAIACHGMRIRPCGWYKPPMECDVLVVGAGPTGLTLAAELRRRGVDCLLIDALEGPQHWDRATVVHPRSLEVFEALGFVDRVLAAGVPQRAARLHSAGEVLVELDFSLSGAAYPYNVGLSEEATERFLTEYLEAAGGSVERSTRLLGMTQDADGVKATVERGGRTDEVRARWIVGCGGYHSPVREAVGIPLEGHDIADPWAVFDVTLGGRTDDFETILVYLEEPMVILTPLPGRRYRVYTRPRSEDADFVADATAVLSIYEPEVELVDIENPTRFFCHAKVAARYREGRALLAGDAAHVCSPDQGHGMNTGIQDAVNLGWKLALVCEGDADPGLLDSYEVERRPVALEVVAAGEGMEEMGRFDGEAARASRDAEVRAALTDPETAHAEAVAEAELNISYRDSPIVAGGTASGEDPSLTNSVEVRSGSSPDSLGPGDRLPDLGPVTAGPGAPEVQLHTLTQRPGHTLLVVAIGDGGVELPHLFAQLEALVARSPLFDAAFALATARGQAPVGTIHPATAAALGVKSLAVLVIRPDRHIGLFVEGGGLDDVERYRSLVTGR